jgi:hypothetical protein
MIMKFRKWLAGKVLGEQVAMFLPNGSKQLMEDGHYENLPDDRLAAVTRYWFYAMNKVHADEADRRDVPLKTYVVSSSVLSLIRHAQEHNADTLTITQSGDIAGVSVGVWQLVLTKIEDDYAFGEPGVVEKEWDGDKLTKATYSFKFGS